MGTKMMYFGALLMFTLFITDSKGAVPFFGFYVYTAAIVFYSALFLLMIGVALRLVGLAAAIKAKKEGMSSEPGTKTTT